MWALTDLAVFRFGRNTVVLEWSIEVTTARKMDANARIVFSMTPREAINESGLPEEKFWQRVRRELERKVSIKRLPSSAVSSYLREALRNRSNEVSLVLKY